MAAKDTAIAVLGGRGMLGSDLVQICRQQGVKPMVYDLPEFDITDVNQVQQAVAGADTIVNCAAYTNVDGAENQAELAYRVNAEAVGRLGTIARQAGKWVLHISTDFVFNGSGDKPTKLIP
jgi:dTDP-4-dehydrorhamnose reductase